MKRNLIALLALLTSANVAFAQSVDLKKATEVEFKHFGAKVAAQVVPTKDSALIGWSTSNKHTQIADSATYVCMDSSTTICTSFTLIARARFHIAGNISMYCSTACSKLAFAHS